MAEVHLRPYAAGTGIGSGGGGGGGSATCGEPSLCRHPPTGSQWMDAIRSATPRRHRRFVTLCKRALFSERAGMVQRWVRAVQLGLLTEWGRASSGKCSQTLSTAVLSGRYMC